MSNLTQLSDKALTRLNLIFEEQEIDRTDYNPTKHPKFNEIKEIIQEFGKEVVKLNDDLFQIEIHNLITKASQISGLITHGTNPGVPGLMKNFIAHNINEHLLNLSQREPLIKIISGYYEELNEEHPLSRKAIENKIFELTPKSTSKMKM